jgi:uncharacterized SAM-binding protein YcdF (DUF218 family)
MFDKFIIALTSPLGFSILAGVVALCLAARHKSRLAWALGCVALVWSGLWSLPVASHTLRGAMEAAYPPLAVNALPRVEAIVVLGGGVRPAELLGRSPNLMEAADRVWHGARLFHASKAPLLVLSGGSDMAKSATSEAEAMRQFALDLGVPDGAILLEERSRNTRQNAQFTAEILKAKGVSQILLVTSALHMRRAVSQFESQGLTVIAAATDHEARSRFTAVDWLPDAEALEGSARAMKELLAQWTGR